jgi:hypothetical protein
MSAVQPLDRTEKLRMIEALWDELAHDKAVLQSPDWHAETLKESEQLHASGQAYFIDWETAKQTLCDHQA